MKERAGKHELPADARALGFEWIADVQLLLGFNNAADGAQGSDQLTHLFPVGIGVIEVCDVGELPNAQGLGLRPEGFAVVDHVVGTQRLAPLDGFGAGGGGDHLKANHLGQGDHRRAHTTRAIDDENGLASVFFGRGHNHALE